MKIHQIKVLPTLTALLLLTILLASCDNILSVRYDPHKYQFLDLPPYNYNSTLYIDSLDATKNAIELNYRISHSSIMTTIPTTLFEHSQLEWLHLQFDTIKNIPADIGKLKNLKYLQIYMPELVELPEEITQLKQLEYLKISGAEQLTELPEHLQNLDFLTLVDNSLEELPPTIGNLKNLKALHLNDANVKLSADIGKLSGLSELYLKKINAKSLPPEIGKLKNLKELAVHSIKKTRAFCLQA